MREREREIGIERERDTVRRTIRYTKSRNYINPYLRRNFMSEEWKDITKKEK